MNTAGTALKSTSGWNGNGSGTNASGFSALPAGLRTDDGNFFDMGVVANFWSSTEVNSDDAYYMYLYSRKDGALLKTFYKSLGLSVRCIQNDPQ